MATIQNDRDVLIQATVPRFSAPTDRAILLATTSNIFAVSGGVSTPTTAVLDATLLNMTGTVTFSTVPTTTLSVTGNQATLAYADMVSNSVVVLASFTLDGITYEARQTVAKVTDGAGGGAQSAIIYAYQRSATTLTSNPGAVTYTFSSGTITTPATDALANGWTKSIPAGTDPLYVTIATANNTTTTDTIAAGEWATPVIFSSNGLNTATVFLYQRTTTATAPTLPASSLTYTFSTGLLTGTLGSWSQTVPAGTGAYLHVTTATALSTSTTDTITSGEWAAVRVMAQDGAEGAILRLNASSQQFTFDSSNAFSPSSQTITFNAILTGSISAGTATFTCTLYNSASTSLGTVTLGGSGNTRTLTHTLFGTSAAYAVVQATYTGGFVDTVTVVKLKDGAAGTSAIVGYLTNESHTVPATTAGVVTSYSGANGFFKVFLGLTDVTGSCTFQIISNANALTPTATTITSNYVVDGSGSWSNSSLIATVTYRATHTPSGATIDKVFSLCKSLQGSTGADGPTGPTGGTGGTGSTGTSNFRIYQVNTSPSAPAAPSNTTSGATPSGWSSTATSSLSTGQFMYQSDGVMAAGSTTTVWGNPYLSNLKVGSLSAITADLGTITSGLITGALIRTASGNPRVELNSTSNSLEVYNASGTNVVSLGGSGYLVANSSGSIPAVLLTNNSGSTQALNIGGSGASILAAGDSFFSKIEPRTHHTYSCGSASAAWTNVYSQNALTVTSDRREKEQITDVEHGLGFIKKLRPVKYKVKEGKRWHSGLIAQEVKAVLGDEDNGVWVQADMKDDNSMQALRYEELIAPMIKAIQELSAKVETLEAKLKENNV